MKLRKTLAGILGAVVMLLGVGTFEHVNREKGVHASDGASYVKADSIAVGDTVLLVAESVKMELSNISTTSTKYGVGSGYDDTPVGVYTLIVESGSEADTYAFKNSSGQYLYWTSGNSLNVNSTLNAKTSWNVTFSNSNAIIKNASDSNRQIWWNVTSPRFACYTGKTDDNSYDSVQLYKLIGTACSHPSYIQPDNPTDDKMKLPATCKRPAVYYEVCSECGASGSNTYEYGELAEHQYDEMNFCKVCNIFNPTKEYSENVLKILNSNYNGGEYERATTIFIDEEKVGADLEHSFPTQKYSDLFHGSTKLLRSTFFTPNALWMENEEGTYSYYGTSGNDLTGGRVANIGDAVDTIALKNVGGMEGYYTTLTDIINKTSEVEWTYENGVYSTTDDTMKKYFLDFTAPCFYNAFSKEQLSNYFVLTSATIEESTEGLVLKLIASGETGKLQGEGNTVLSQAIIKDWKLLGNDKLDTDVTIDFTNEANRTQSSTSEQQWEENGIYFTYSKGSYTNNLAEYTPIRLYKGTQIKIECDYQFNKVVFNCTSDAYATSLAKSIGGNAVASANNVSVTLADLTNSVTYTISDGQTRCNSITLSAN